MGIGHLPYAATDCGPDVPSSSRRWPVPARVGSRGFTAGEETTCLRPAGALAAMLVGWLPAGFWALDAVRIGDSIRAPYAELDWVQFRAGEPPRCCCGWMALCAITKNPLASAAFSSGTGTHATSDPIPGENRVNTPSMLRHTSQSPATGLG